TILANDGEGVRFWDAATGRPRPGFDNLRGDFRGLAVSHDGSTVAVCDGNAALRLFHLATGKEICQLRGHKYAVFALDFAPDGKTRASAGPDDTIRLWDVATGKEIRQCQAEQRFPNRVAFSPDGRTLATVSSDPRSDQSLRIWDVATGRQRYCIP